MSKTDFQYGSCGGHLEFPTDTILAHFNPEVVLLLQSKFRLKSTMSGKRCRKLIFKIAAVAAILDFRMTSPLKPLSQFCSNFIRSLFRLGEQKIAKMVAVR